MSHRIVKDSQIFPRMAKDVKRHNRRLREAIKRNLPSIIADEDIITADRNRTLRVPIKQLREWRFSYDYNQIPIVGHGDGRERETCPRCNGSGCDTCKQTGLVPKTIAKRIRFIEDFQRQIALSEEIDEPEEQPPPSEDSRSLHIDPRKGKTGHPRSLTGDRLSRRKDGEGCSGKKGGDQPGDEVFETDISIAELEEILFEELSLPNLEDKGLQKITKEQFKFDEILKVGPLSSLDKKQTFRANIKRNAREKGAAHFGDIMKEDLRFRRWDVEEEDQACAVIFALMDVSGSMDEFKKFIARSFYHWMKRFLEQQYDEVRIRFIAHHTEAKEVNEHDFFNRGESGGTMMSSAWQLAHKIMQEDYPVSDWNIYVFHFSDGENFSNDNDDLVDGVTRCLQYGVNMIGYGEITAEDENERSYPFWAAPTRVKSMLEEQFTHESRFVVCEIEETDDVWKALRKFFSKNPVARNLFDNDELIPKRIS